MVWYLKDTAQAKLSLARSLNACKVQVHHGRRQRTSSAVAVLAPIAICFEGMIECHRIKASVSMGKGKLEFELAT